MTGVFRGRVLLGMCISCVNGRHQCHGQVNFNIWYSGKPMDIYLVLLYKYFRPFHIMNLYLKKLWNTCLSFVSTAISVKYFVVLVVALFDKPVLRLPLSEHTRVAASTQDDTNSISTSRSLFIPSTSTRYHHAALTKPDPLDPPDGLDPDPGIQSDRDQRWRGDQGDAPPQLRVRP